MNYFAVTGLLWLSVVGITSYGTISTLNRIIFQHYPIPLENMHSEYYFGKCAARKTLIARDTFEYKHIKGKIIVRGYLPEITNSTVPNCVYIKATSDQGDMIRYNAYKFTVCVIRIIIRYTAKTFQFYYYEWFVPVQMQQNVTWDVFFYLA